MMTALNTFIYSNKIWIRLLRHFIFWAADIMNYLLVISVRTGVTPERVYRLLFTIPLIILVTYFILYFIIPSLSIKPSNGKLILWGLAVFIYIGVGVHYYTNYIINPMLDPQFEVPANIWDLRRILGEAFTWATVIFMAIAIKLIKSKTELQQKNEELIEEKKVAELNFLKSQMHPHFLFNTLNTLYSDAIQNTGKSEQIVLRLSNLMRFILDECNKPFIPLGSEIKVIEDYIALETLRHGSRLKIDFHLTIEDKSKRISPLLLLPFIENSCKHTLSTITGAISINVTLKADHSFVYLFVQNDMVKNGYHNGVKHGMGISNVKKQLDLLYNSKYVFETRANNGKHTVNLIIPFLN